MRKSLALGWDVSHGNVSSSGAQLSENVLFHSGMPSGKPLERIGKIEADERGSAAGIHRDNGHTHARKLYAVASAKRALRGVALEAVEGVREVAALDAELERAIGRAPHLDRLSTLVQRVDDGSFGKPRCARTMSCNAAKLAGAFISTAPDRPPHPKVKGLRAERLPVVCHCGVLDDLPARRTEQDDGSALRERAGVSRPPNGRGGEDQCTESGKRTPACHGPTPIHVAW